MSEYGVNEFHGGVFFQWANTEFTVTFQGLIHTNDPLFDMSMAHGDLCVVDLDKDIIQFALKVHVYDHEEYVVDGVFDDFDHYPILIFSHLQQNCEILNNFDLIEHFEPINVVNLDLDTKLLTCKMYVICRKPVEERNKIISDIFEEYINADHDDVD